MSVVETVRSTPLPAIARRWPTALGVAGAAGAGYGLIGGSVEAGVAQATSIAVPVLIYLSAAVSDRPRAAWPLCGGAVVLIAATSALGVEPVLGLSVVSAGVLGIGIGRRVVRGDGVPSSGQLVGAVGFGAVAVTALYVQPTAGALLVGLGLLGHAIWDVVHHRRDAIVVRSSAEFCAVFDTLVGVAVIGLTVAAIR